MNFSKLLFIIVFYHVQIAQCIHNVSTVSLKHLIFVFGRRRSCTTPSGADKLSYMYIHCLFV